MAGAKKNVELDPTEDIDTDVEDLDVDEDIDDEDSDDDVDDESDVEDTEDIDDEDSDDDEEEVEEKVVEKKPKAEKTLKKDKKKKDEEVELSTLDIKSQNVFGDLQILKRKGKFIEGKKGIEMRKAFMKDELVSVLIPVDAMNPKKRIHEFQMNSLYFVLPLGKSIKVPKTVADYIDQTIFASQPIHEALIGSFN